MNYYNDNDKKACAWLRELIAVGLIPNGDVDERSILDVKADDLRGYQQCHFFTGVGFWSLALQWAGLGDAPGIWTGSCPCQPFSCAGPGKGTADERHLWPVFRDLIAACRPAVVFGEQVASAAVVGKVGKRVAAPAVPVWIDGVRADVEAAGYTFGHAVLGAHSVGAPHIRQRVYWVADSGARDTTQHRPEVRRDVHGELHREGLGEGCHARRPSNAEHATGEPWRVADVSGERAETTGERSHAESGRFGATYRLPESEHDGRRQHEQGRGSDRRAAAGRDCEIGGTSDMQGQRCGEAGGRGQRSSQRSGEFSEPCRSSVAACGGQRTDGSAPGRTGHAEQLQQTGWACDVHDAGPQGRNGGSVQEHANERIAGQASTWSDYRIHRYLDRKDRRIPTEPRLFPLADDRHPYHRGRVGLLRGAGNAIVPALAKEFIAAWLECRCES